MSHRAYSLVWLEVFSKKSYLRQSWTEYIAITGKWQLMEHDRVRLFLFVTQSSAVG